MTDAERFDAAVRGIVGKRITYGDLIGNCRQEYVLQATTAR
jgi:hypothetical protein